MQAKFGFKNRMAVPRLIKVVVNVGISAANKDQKFLEVAKETLRTICGQQPVERKARLSIAGFKVRKGQIVGLKATLRGPRMYDFLEKLLRLALPRVRDFRGLKESAVDAGGNLTIGFREAVAFPEVKAGDMERQHGLEITVATNARVREQGLELFKLLGFPFRDR